MSRREAIGLTVFFLIAFGIPWAGWTVLEHLDLPYWLLPIFCSIAGFVASYAEGGADGLHRFCQRTLHVRGTAKFIFLAAFIPMMLGLLYLLGANAPFSLLQPALKPGLAMTLAMALVTGPLAEEFGWRGYLQAKLLRYMRPLWVALTVGVIWCAWHIPLFSHLFLAQLNQHLAFWPSALHGQYSSHTLFLAPMARFGRPYFSIGQ